MDNPIYKVGDGFQDAHGRAVDEHGTLLDPSADANNLSAQQADAVAAQQQADANPIAAEPESEEKPKAKHAAKKAKKKHG